MRSILKKYWLLIVAIIAMIIAFAVERNLEKLELQSVDAENFEDRLHEKEKKTEKMLNNISREISDSGLTHFAEKAGRHYYNMRNQEGIVILVYKDENLRYWNSSDIPEHSYEEVIQTSRPVYHSGNSWYVRRKKETGNITLAALILIKNDYLFENKFLSNTFHRDFDLNPNVEIKFSPRSGFPVENKKGEYLFSLIPPSPPAFSLLFTRVCITLFFISFSLLLLFFYKSFHILKLNTQKAKNIWFAAIAGIIVMLRWLMLQTDFPDVSSVFTLFSPHLYGKSFTFASLGDLLINSVLLFFISLLFSKYFRITYTKSRGKNMAKIGLLTSFLVFIFLYFHYLFEGLIINSSIQLQVHNFFYLNQYSLLAYISIAFLFATFLLLADHIVHFASNLIDIKVFALITAVISCGGAVIYYASGYSLDLPTVLFYILVISFTAYIRYYRYSYKFPNLVFVVFLISLFTLYFVTDKSREKERNIRRVLVVNLANERDQVAEFLLEDIEKEIAADSVLYEMLGSMKYEEYELFDYLEENYFNSFFRKYELQVAACGPDYNIYLEDTQELVDCYTFFEDMIYDYGIRINPESNFFFLDNLNGRISYLGTVTYSYDHYPEEKTVYISLDSRIATEQLGYPELLIEGELTEHQALRNYSYAKYHNNRLITRYGDFPYALKQQYTQQNDETYTFFEHDGYNHLIYRADEDNTIILSKPETRTINLLTSFSYTFIFYFSLLGIALLVYNLPLRRSHFRLTLKNRIKLSMISIVLLSLIIVGAGTIYYNIRQFENKHQENITEKIQSVLVELENEFMLEEELTPELQNYMSGLLTDLSNVFYTDINLYDPDGNLYATSRPEIFELNLTGEKMSPGAYSKMVIENNPRFLHRETIGELSYLSAYVPFTNADNEVLAYLNLPYFTRQGELQREIYTVVVAVVNIYALLILITIVTAIFVSNQITKPLKLIQNKLRKIRLEQKNEQISYRGDDEIGDIVKDYNRMVTELEKSAELLAKSEREGAWREMAKQIAHEIKNPLTPMKLSIQHMQRAWEDGHPCREEVIKKTCKSLIDQIDNLSSIATEFSNFAKMPHANPEKTDILKEVENSLELFINAEKIEFKKNFNGHREVFVYIDQKQLNRVFINLIKNAVQSIPKNSNGAVNLEVDKAGGHARVKISDTGTGIPEDMKDKMFRPNFTTKSGGMGLGLAISKKIIESAGGSIWYDTEPGKGSNFYLMLPLYEKNDLNK